MLIKPDAKKIAKIKLVGVGGGGCNAVATMIGTERIEGVEFIAINTDAQALLINKAETKVQIGDKVTKGLGAGGNPEIGKQAAEESRERLKEYLDGADLVFITAGMGGGTGTGASPIVAEVAKESGALTIAVVTKPFGFEGSRRMVVATDGIKNLKEKVDALITIPNQKVIDIGDKKLTLLSAFREVDTVLTQGVKGLAEIITLPGLINVDFADVKAIMQNAGTAIMGIGMGTGERRAVQAVKQAMTSPLLELSIDGAKGVLFNIVGGENLTMSEVHEAAELITKNADPNAQIIFGAAIDPSLTDDIKITLVATKFDESRINKDSVSSITSELPERSNDDYEELEIPAFLRKKVV
ncbi:MAG: cell division protein FtsZ [Patescibacteria group bacterium]|jgi:cell division protein FtsZ